MTRRKKKNNQYKRKQLNKKEEEAIFISVGIALILFVVYAIIEWIKSHIIESIALGIFLIGILYLIFKNKIKDYFNLNKDENLKELNRILKSIKNFKYEIIRDEEILETQIKIKLENLGYKVNRQNSKNKRRIDLVINNKFGIELKVFEGKTSTLQRLYGQVNDYKKTFQYIGVVILSNKEFENNQELKYYIKELEKLENVKVCHIISKIKRKKK